MFHQERFPSFHSRTSLTTDVVDRPLTNDDRAHRLTLWRDSIVPSLEKTIGAGLSDKLKERKSDLRKLSYLPTRLSKLEGIEKFFASAPTGKILIPSVYKSSPKNRGKIFYLIPRNAILYYGPYYFMGILDYRTERLHGLQTALKFAGANVILRPSNHINHVSIWYLEKEIFTCRLTDLHHGGDGELDRICYDAAVAFSTQSKKAMLHVRHRYPFDKQKANLLVRKCPCHDDYQPNIFMDDDDFNTEEEEDLEDEEDDESFYYIDPYSKVTSRKTTAGTKSTNVYSAFKAQAQAPRPPSTSEPPPTDDTETRRVNRIGIVRVGRKDDEISRRSTDTETQTTATTQTTPQRKSLKQTHHHEHHSHHHHHGKHADPTEEDARRELIQTSKAAISKYIPKVNA